MTALSDLETLLEQAKEASQHADAMIYEWRFGVAPKAGSVPPYTSSLDAAVQLARTVLPGWFVTWTDALPGERNHSVQLAEGYGLWGENTTHYTAALALCLAVCRAKIAMEQQP